MSSTYAIVIAVFFLTISSFISVVSIIELRYKVEKLEQRIVVLEQI